MHRARWTFLVLLCGSVAAHAQSFSGTWTGELGTLSLKQQGARVSGTATIEGTSGTMAGSVQGATVTGTYVAEGESGAWQGQLQGDTLMVSFDGEVPLPFRRAGAKGAAVPPPTVPPPGSSAMGPPDSSAMGMTPGPAAPKVAAADGAEVRSEAEGWSARTPPKWKSKSDGQRVVFGSDTEAGLIVAGFTEGTTFEELQQGAAQGFTDSGLALTPAAQPQTLEVRAGRGVAVDMQTTAQDGTPLKVRAAGVAGGSGAVVVIGFTTAEKFSGLRGRVDQIAKSVAFFAPKVPPGANFLTGAMCSYSGGSVASWTRRFFFDGKGHVSFGSEMAAGGNFTNSGGDVTGAWGGASGNQYNPSNAGSYVVQGNQVVIRMGGEATTCGVKMRQNSGRITELMCNGRLYAPALCE